MLALVVLTYAAVGYYHFRMTLRACEDYDTPASILLNSAIALTIGPTLLIPAFIYGFIDRRLNP